MADAYLRQRRVYSDISGSLDVAAATDDTTLVTGKASHTIYIQRIIFMVTTDAAQSMAFVDSNSSAKQIGKVSASPGVDTRWDFDFGSTGVPLTEAKNFVMNVSAAGLAGQLMWEGYIRQSSTMTA